MIYLFLINITNENEIKAKMSNFVCDCGIVLHLSDPSCYSCYDKPTRASSSRMQVVKSVQSMTTTSDPTFCDFLSSLISLVILIFVQLIKVINFLFQNLFYILSPVISFSLPIIMTMLMILGCLMILFVSTVYDIFNTH